MKNWYFYSANDKRKEQINTYKADSKEESIEYFAKVKQMSIDVFLTIYTVEECKI
tara:strand:- start:837 stop:1001 length:165 start_codon:yes stop_codon:yes gene_type:complete